MDPPDTPNSAPNSVPIDAFKKFITDDRVVHALVCGTFVERLLQHMSEKEGGCIRPNEVAYMSDVIKMAIICMSNIAKRAD